MSQVDVDDHYGYGSIPNPLELDLENIDGFEIKHSSKTSRRWSVLEKLDNRHYCGIRSFYDCLRICNLKSMLAIVMLGSFVVMIYLFMKALLFVSDINYPTQFDFIVIGGGSAGSVVTKRLVDAGARVLLLEAGDGTQYDLKGTDNFSGPLTRFDIPLLWSSISKFVQFRWEGFNSSDILLAKGLGGCGISSGMIYMRAVKTDIEKWNVEGWSWNEMFEKYQSLETFVPHSGDHSKFHNDSWFHGYDGPIVTSTQQYMDEVAPLFMAAGEELGLGSVSDFNDPDRSRAGVGRYHLNVASGVRDSAAKALLGPILRSEQKNNLVLSLGGEVQRVLLSRQTVLLENDKDTSAYRVSGVEYLCNGQLLTAYLKQGPSKLNLEGKRSVILAAGAVMTPKLLMNSGIGPREVLEAAGIPVRVPSPQVGRNLQDHRMVGMVMSLDAEVAASYPTSYSFATDWIQYMDAVQAPLDSTVAASSPEKRSSVDYGIMGSTGHSAGAFLVSPFALEDSASGGDGESSTGDAVPDIQLTLYPTVSEPHFVETHWRNSSSFRRSDRSLHEILVTVALLCPEGRQEVRLNVTHPLEAVPLLIPGPEGMLTPRDVQRLTWAVERVRQIFATEPLKTAVTGEVSPGPGVRSRAEVEAWVLRSSFSSSNFAGSARMAFDAPDADGQRGDTSEAVLDEFLRVRGVQGLVVADASAMPHITNGNIHATVLAVADIAADKILQGVRRR